MTGLLDAAKATRFVRKAGWNDHFKYAFVSEADVKREVGNALAAAGLVVSKTEMHVDSFEVVEKPGKGKDAPPKTYQRVTVQVRLTVKDVATDTVVGSYEGLGTGMDGDDKAVYKAMAGAVKYALTTAFLIETGDDPEGSDADGKDTNPAQYGSFADLLAAAPGLLAAGDVNTVKLEAARYADHPQFGQLKALVKAAAAS